MTTPGLLEKPLELESPHVSIIGEEFGQSAFSPANSVRDEQILALVEQLFFRDDSPGVRHVGFSAVEAQPETAFLSLEVAMMLAESGSRDVGLIDAGVQSIPLQTLLKLQPARSSDAEWQIGPRLWFVPRRSWLAENGQRIWDPGLTRLRKATMEYDYSVVCFDPLSWVTARISQVCDGVVMVLTANKTRRLVAAQMQEQLQKARIPVLGTVLADRRFPVPQRLYRNL